MTALALTCGDAAGIGPELVLHALNRPPGDWGARLVAYGHAGLLRRVADASGIPFPADLRIRHMRGPWQEGATCHELVETQPDDAARAAAVATLEPGHVQRACGGFACEWVRAAVSDALAGRVQGVVTAPASKQAMHLAGSAFPGHTELLAHLTGTPEDGVRMMFHSPRLRVVLDSIHISLAAVPGLLNVPHLLATLRHAAATAAVETPAPRVGLLALNPHAGEDGLFGDEETRVLRPAIAAARAEGLDVSGPLVPDTAFCWLADPAQPAPCDVYVALYHDQGLIPFKLAAFLDGVNTTLGLPIVRTSPDHGTAFPLAWRGLANPSSFSAAIRLARILAQHPPGKRP